MLYVPSNMGSIYNMLYVPSNMGSMYSNLPIFN